MCLIAVAYRVHPRYPLIVAANRDEFLDRDADAAHFWPDEPRILAGRDRRAMGTWMGITTQGRFAALTNHRDLRRPPVQGPSRGLLVRDALLGPLADEGVPREGYNLMHGPIGALRYRSNMNGADAALAPGLHGLSNAFLDTPWPKVRRAVQSLERAIQGREPDVEALFRMLGDRQQAADGELPDTGLGIERERALSSIRIDLPGYGTRCSTVLLVGRDGGVRLEERTWRTGQAVQERFLL